MSDLAPRYPLIFNPKARSTKGRRALRWVMSQAHRFTLLATNHADEAFELAKRFADAGEPIVCAAGGDGTLNHVVKGLAGSESALGVLPTGTMNVFARELGLPLDDLSRALEVIDSGRFQEVDLFTANGHPFLQMAGVGLDAQVIDETSWESKKALGPLAYLISAVKILGEKAPQLVVEDASGRRLEGACVLAGNGCFYGGQFKLFPEANNSDRLLDVVVFKEAGYKLVAETMRGLVQGKIDIDSRLLEYFTTSELRVHSLSGHVPVEVDGELMSECPVHFTHSQHRLKVFAPEQRIGSRFEEAVKSWIPWMKKD